MDKPFWEQTYKDDSVFTFGAKPTRDIEMLADSFKRGCKVLDIGCGEGKNSLYLAKKGLEVDAFDLSDAGVSKLKRIAEKENVILNAWVQDLTSYKFDKFYDVIMTHGVLHLVEKFQWKEFITQMKAHTNQGGLNVIGIFTDTLPASPDIAQFTKGLFKEGELKELYEDWQIIDFSSKIFDDQHPGGIRHKHAANNIIAKKIK